MKIEAGNKQDNACFIQKSKSINNFSFKNNVSIIENLKTNIYNLFIL
jgi:hypothetical protein